MQPSKSTSLLIALITQLDVVRTLHAHSEEKKKALQRNYSDVYDEFEKVHRELDALSTELSSLTDRSVALDANFSRYGYNANIRRRLTLISYSCG